MKRWQKVLLGTFAGLTLWASSEIGSSAVAQHYENKGDEALSQALLSYGRESNQEVQKKIEGCRSYYAESIWWGRLVEKIGPRSRLLQSMGEEQTYLPEGVPLLLQLEGLLEAEEQPEEHPLQYLPLKDSVDSSAKPYL